ncbi:MAG: hypothetical protein QW279_10765 [Candidatus Jordarchaeaceae archaeon]
MKSIRWLKLSMITPLVALLMLPCEASYAETPLFKPTWLNKGVYVEYTFGEGVVELFNNTSRLGFDFVTFHGAIFRWDCIDLNETLAKLKISLILTEAARNGETTEENKTTQLTTEVLINIMNRAVYLQNGTLIGTTHLWLPANPTLGDSLILWDVPPYKVILKIAEQTAYAPETPQGPQEVFKIEGSGETGGSVSLFTILSDLDTGILVDGGLDNEGTMRALNIRDFSYSGRMLFTDTNIDLGPKGTSFDLTALFGFLAIPVAFIIIFIAIYRSSRKNRGKR